jgi:hypothetical protein
VLERSPTARGALADFAALMAPAVHGPLLFRTQAGQSDGAIPDLVGGRAAGSQPLVIEAKF